MRERLPLHYVSWRHVIMFSIAGSMRKIYFTQHCRKKQVTDISLVLKDSDM